MVIITLIGAYKGYCFFDLDVAILGSPLLKADESTKHLEVLMSDDTITHVMLAGQLSVTGKVRKTIKNMSEKPTHNELCDIISTILEADESICNALIMNSKGELTTFDPNGEYFEHQSDIYVDGEHGFYSIGVLHAIDEIVDALGVPIDNKLKALTIGINLIRKNCGYRTVVIKSINGNQSILE